MPIRRCSGLSTRNSPPKLHHAWPPRLASDSWSRSTTERPASASSHVATSPARPAPTTTTSASMGRPYAPSTRTRPPSTEAVRWVRSGTTRSASGTSSSSGVVPSTATSARQRAARAARSPATASSTTTQSVGSTPSRRAPSSHGSGHGFPRSTSDAVTSAAGRVSPVAAMRASARSLRAGRDDAGGHAAVGEGRQQVGRAGKQHDALDVAHLDLPDAGERLGPALLRQQLGDDVRRGHPVETGEPHRVDVVLLAPPHPGAHDGGDRVDEGAVEVEQHPAERRPEGLGGRRPGGRGRRRVGGERHGRQPRWCLLGAARVNPVEQLAQAHRVRRGVAELVVVEVAVHPVPGALPLAQPVGPPAQVVVAVGAGVEVLVVRPVPAHVDQVARRPQHAGQLGAAHDDVGRPVTLEDGEHPLVEPRRVPELDRRADRRRQVPRGRRRAGRRHAPSWVAAGAAAARRGRRAAASPAR